MESNKYKVPTKQWKKWYDLSRYTFNDLYSLFKENNFHDTFLKHPKAPDLNKEHVKTLAWNTAWLAADAVQNGIENYSKKV